MTINYLAVHGETLLAKGYPIIPIRDGTKYPGFRGWQNTIASPDKLDTWLANGHNTGVGILTAHHPAVDLDVLDPDIVSKLVQWCADNIGPTVQRVGCPPKQLLVYRASEPFSKITSSKYIDYLGVEHKVEILGAGQQCVAYATHPDTKQPYRWISEKSLVDVTPEDLPVISAAQAEALIAYFESLIPGDWSRVESGQAAQEVETGIPVADRALAHAKPALDISTEDLRKTLDKLDPDMRMHEWIRVGMALYHQYSGSAEGFALWDNWSSYSCKYDQTEMRTRWRSFEADLIGTDPVTAATILKMAKQNEDQDNATLLAQFLDRYVLISQGELVCDLDAPPHCAISKLSEFRNVTANIRHLVPAPTQSDPGREKLQPVHMAWLVDEARKTAKGVKHDPAKPFFFEADDGLWWVNEHHLPTFKAAPNGDTSTFHEHMTYLLPIAAEREWFIDWLAFNLQKPEMRSKVTPLHVSLHHGSGRGWVVELMGRLLGHWNCTKTKLSTMAGEGSEGAYQDYLDKSLFCAVEEVREGKQRYTVSDKIRDVLESQILPVNIKYGGKSTRPVFTNFFLMTNHPDALVLTKEDRRIQVLSGPDTLPDDAYFRKLYGWLETDGVAALHAELMQRDLSAFNWQRSSDTPARQRMIENNRSETEELFHEFIKSPPCGAMTYTQIEQELTKLSGEDAFDVQIEKGQLIKLLQHYATRGPRLKVAQKAVRPWLFNPKIANDDKRIREEVSSYGL